MEARITVSYEMIERTKVYSCQCSHGNCYSTKIYIIRVQMLSLLPDSIFFSMRLFRTIETQRAKSREQISMKQRSSFANVYCTLGQDEKYLARARIQRKFFK